LTVKLVWWRRDSARKAQQKTVDLQKARNAKLNHNGLKQNVDEAENCKQSEDENDGSDNGEDENEEMLRHGHVDALLDWASKQKEYNKYLPLDGDIYRFLAFGLGRRSTSNSIMLCGVPTNLYSFFLVIAIQILAPMAVFCVAYAQIDWDGWVFGVDHLDIRPSMHPGTYNYFLSNTMKYALGFPFLACFCVHGLHSLRDEADQGMKASCLGKYVLQDNTFTYEIAIAGTGDARDGRYRVTEYDDNGRAIYRHVRCNEYEIKWAEEGNAWELSAEGGNSNPCKFLRDTKAVAQGMNDVDESAEKDFPRTGNFQGFAVTHSCRRLSAFTGLWLRFGAVVNCYVIVMCSLDMVLLFWLAEGPKDIVFDSLSLLFLFTLDNSSSDLNVISCANWDDEVIGTFYWEKMQRYVEDLGYPAWSEDDGVDVKDIADQTTFPDIYYERMPYVYVFSIWFMGHCCVALPLLFLFTTGGTGTEARVQDDIQTLSQKFLEFGTTLDVLRHTASMHELGVV